MNYEKKITRPNNPHWMLLLTPLAAFTGLYAFYKKFYIIAFAEWLLVSTSILYWSCPSCNTRRLIDMVIVNISLFIHLGYSLLFTIVEPIVFYILGMVSYKLGVDLDSNFFHMGIWIFGCIGNIFLIYKLSLM